jgi:hypothetical protein
MADETKTAPVEQTPAPEKEASKTELFKAHIQKIIKDTLGVRVSKASAWDLFKDVINGTVEFVQNQPSEKAEDEEAFGARRLPLAGVGSFEIIETKPRNTKAGLVKNEKGEWVRDEKLKVWPYVPRFRFYASSKISELLEQVNGLEDHGVEVKHYGLYAPEKPKAEPAPKKEKAEKAEAPKADKAPEMI